MKPQIVRDNKKWSEKRYKHEENHFRIPRMCSHGALAGRLRQPGFTLTLDDAGQWLRSRVVWLGTRQPPRGLLQLASMLRAQAARSGCYQSPQPFHPHITLWRDARQAVPIPAPGFRWTFPVNEFVLYESSFSRGRTRYTALERYPFDKES